MLRAAPPSARLHAPLLSVAGLRISFAASSGRIAALHGVELAVRRGEIVCLVGESGSGKTLTALACAGLLPPEARVDAGRIELADKCIVDAAHADFAGVRGRRIGMIFQEPMTSLNPVLTVGEQIAETFVRHKGRNWRAAWRDGVALLDRVGITDPDRRARQYVHQLSGGMRQRVMIACAIAANPELLIADEPTTALDVTVQAQILDLIRRLRDEIGMGVLFISHDLGIVSEIGDRLYVMYAGRVVEHGPTAELLRRPRMPYTRGLLRALPDEDVRKERLYAIPGSTPDPRNLPPGCAFAPRCEHARPACDAALPRLEPAGAERHVRCLRWREINDEPRAALPAAAMAESRPGAERKALLSVRDLVKHFPTPGTLFASTRRVRAVDGVSFEVGRGEVLALVGESGSGKTTIGRSILRLVEPSSGSIAFDGVEITGLPAAAMNAVRARMQIIFQDPFASLDPRMRIGDALGEPLRHHRIVPHCEISARIACLLEQVGLERDAARRLPSAFSGGQRQRIAIARALAVEPDLIVADEAVSALDVSIRAQITNLLHDLRKRLSLSLLFITHDLAMVRQIADRVVILYLGRVMEIGPVDTVFARPRHPYTRVLLSAVPIPDPDRRRERIILAGEMPSPIDPPSGCVFRTRCPRATGECATGVPEMASFGPAHRVACIHPL